MTLDACSPRMLFISALAGIKEKASKAINLGRRQMTHSTCLADSFPSSACLSCSHLYTLPCVRYQDQQANSQPAWSRVVLALRRHRLDRCVWYHLRSPAVKQVDHCLSLDTPGLYFLSMASSVSLYFWCKCAELVLNSSLRLFHAVWFQVVS